MRGVVAALTDAGRRRLEQAAPGNVAAVRGLLIDVLTGEQLAAVADGLGEVARRRLLQPPPSGVGQRRDHAAHIAGPGPRRASPAFSSWVIW